MNIRRRLTRRTSGRCAGGLTHRWKGIHRRFLFWALVCTLILFSVSLLWNSHQSLSKADDHTTIDSAAAAVRAEQMKTRQEDQSSGSDDRQEDDGLATSAVSFFYDVVKSARMKAGVADQFTLDNLFDMATDLTAIASEYIIRDAASKQPLLLQEQDHDDGGDDDSRSYAMQPPEVQIDCGHADFASALTGRKAIETKKYIIEVVPFGFDVDFLEMRLLEHYDIVDKFVLIEQDATLKGTAKPHLLVEILQMERFAVFADKIEYIPYQVPKELKSRIKAYDGEKKMLSLDRRIEHLMRSAPIDYLRETMFSASNNNDLDTRAVFVIQNDGDEIISRRALAHFKQCQHREGHYPIYAPCLGFKRNVAWLQETYDMRKLKLAGTNETTSSLGELRNFLWKLGPTIWRWQDVHKHGSTHREGSHAGSLHLGLGAANHFSSPSNPILMLIKNLSTVSASLHSFSPGFWQKVHNKTVSSEDIERELFVCRSTGMFRHVHLESLGPVVTQFVIDSLPWAVTAQTHPYRYPWLYDSHLLQKEKRLFEESDCVNKPQSWKTGVRSKLDEIKADISSFLYGFALW